MTKAWSGLRPQAQGSLAAALLAALVLAGAGFAALACLSPPTVPEDAGVEEFSALRARADVAVLAQSPHPLGTARQQEVRDHLLARLRDLDLEARVQRTVTLVEEGPGWTLAATVENVMGRLPGSGEGDGALLLAAHYDTVPGSPGANDNAAGVAALLETARALKAGPSLHHDVIFLFTDGEEIALFGARAFREQHPWMEDVALVLNFEARGLGGTSLLFETGPGTGPSLLRRFADVATRPVAASYGQDVYRYLPNDTDFTELSLRSGVPGFNFAYIDGLAGYHSRRDTPGNLDLRSLQHHGEYALSLTRHFAGGQGADLPRRDGAGDRSRVTYFNLPLIGLVTYPTAWAPVPGALGAALLGLALALGLRRRRLRSEGIGLALVAALLAIVTGGLLTLIIDRAAFAVAATGPEVLDGPWPYLLAMPILAAAGVGAALLVARRWVSRLELATGGQLLWLALTVLALFLAPSSSYLFSWPLLAAAVTTLVSVLTAPEPAGEPTRKLPPSLVAGLAALAVLIFLWAPLAYLLGLALGAAGATALIVLGGLSAVLALPLLPGAGWPRPWLWAATTAVAWTAILVATVATAGYDAEQPRPNTLFYILDTQTDGAWWASFDDEVDPWTGRFLSQPETRDFPDLFSPGPHDLLSTPAPVLDFKLPRVEVVSGQAVEDGGRQRLRLRVVSPRGGQRVRLALTTEAPPLHLLEVDGRPRKSADEGTPPGGSGNGLARQELRYYGVPEEGFEVTVETGPGPLTATMTDRVLGLPGSELPGWEARPADAMARPSTPTDFSEIRVQRSLAGPAPTGPDTDTAEDGTGPAQP